MTDDPGAWERWQELLRQVNPDPLEVIKQGTAFSHYFEAVVREAVAVATKTGRTDDEIAAALGVHRDVAGFAFARLLRFRKSA